MSLIHVLRVLAVIGPSLAYSSTCANNGTTCPPPKWKPQWHLSLSTMCQPGGGDDYFVPPANQPWGLVSLDWSVNEKTWRHPEDMTKCTCEATSIENCRRIKAVSPGTRCFIYHNLELALEAMESQRAVMYNKSTANYFLQYTDGQGHKNGTIYNERDTPGDQYFWDFRVKEAADYYIATMLATTSDPAVDGTFTDDVTGLPAEHPRAIPAMNLTQQEVKDIQAATADTSARLIDALIAAGKYNWQAFGHDDGVGPSVTQSNCVSFMRKLCADQKLNPQPALTMAYDSKNPTQSIAGFLVGRSEIAYLGYGWESDQRSWQPIFLYQVGEPTETCSEPSTGVFVRQWTAGQAKIDCNSWTGVIPGH